MLFFYTLIIAVFFSGIFYYLINFALVPYNSEDVLDIHNLVIVSIVFVLSATSIFSLFHLIFDKLFFRKFYEKPRILLAMRRGLLLGILLAGYAWVRVFGFWTLEVVLLFTSLIFLTEALLLSLTANTSLSSKEKKEQN